MDLYEIVFSGELVPGAQPELVKANLAKLFSADAQRIDALFSGRRLVLRSNLDPDAAQKYRAALERAGALVRVEIMALLVEEIEMAPPPDQVRFVRAVASSQPMPPPAPTPSAPQSVHQLREQKRAKVIPRDVYMAAFTEVDAPDYGIAAVGADLQDEKPSVRPPVLDLTQFSLAPAGSDMGELKRAAAKAAPDTSHLRLIR
ncbi:hypothetical protein [Pseudomonas sp. nanlin1]|uniref:hypothetical protein n=1 Tax=Pseudomonas sp. nanlin1 TaxID=3040605 RepID=UPI00388E0211